MITRTQTFANARTLDQVLQECALADSDLHATIDAIGSTDPIAAEFDGYAVLLGRVAALLSTRERRELTDNEETSLHSAALRASREARRLSELARSRQAVER